MYQRILAPLDGSEAAEEALPHVRALANCAGAHVVLLRVVEPMMMPPWPTFAGPELSAREPSGSAEDAAQYLERHVRFLEGLSIPAEAIVLHGPAADEILECITAQKIDLVVLCRQGRSGIVRLIGGRTTEAVLARATVPVMVVPVPATTRAAR